MLPSYYYERCMCGAGDCRSCYPNGCDEPEEDESAMTYKTVTARKARFVGKVGEIRVGDTVRVTSGFMYQKDGPRTGYLRKGYRRIAKGPAWVQVAQAA